MPFQIPKLRWVIAALLFLATTLNYADRLALSVVSVDVRREFHMDEQDYAMVLTIFLIAYAVMYAGSGWVVDRLGTRRGFALFLTTWSISQICHGLAVGKWSLALCRFGLGLSEPGNFPAAAKAVAEWFPPSQRALGIGIFNSGTSFGSILAPPMVAFLTLRYGWRFAFVFTGSLGFVWIAAWLAVYHPPHGHPRLRPDEYEALKNEVEPPAETKPAAGSTRSWRTLMSMRECYTLMLARFFTDPVTYFVIFWLPEYLRRERGFDLSMIGKYAWVPFVFGDIGYLLGGWLSGRLIQAGWTLPKARKLALLVGACVMPAAIWAPRVPEVWMAIAAACCMTFGHGCWASNLLTFPLDLFRGKEVGTVTGFSGMGGGIGGALANLGTGWVVAHFSYTPVFLVAGLMHPLSFVLVYLLLPDRYFAQKQQDQFAH